MGKSSFWRALAKRGIHGAIRTARSIHKGHVQPYFDRSSHSSGKGRPVNALLVAAVLILVPLQTTPQRVNGVIQGTVTQFGQNAPLPNVEIRLRSVTEGYFINASPDTVTDEEGRFVIRDVIPGKYVLHASRPGYVNPAINGV